MTLDTVLLALLVISALVVIHEAGHYWASRWVNLPVLEFAVGFGPVLMQMINKRGERISLRALPFGGYVRMLQNADFPQQKTAKATVDSGWPFSQEQAYENLHLWQKIVILLAGPAANLLTAILVLTALYWTGISAWMPAVAVVETDSPAAEIGLESGDVFVEFDGRPVSSSRDLLLGLVDHLGSEGSLEVVVERGGVHRRLAGSFARKLERATSASCQPAGRIERRTYPILTLPLGSFWYQIAARSVASLDSSCSTRLAGGKSWVAGRRSH